MLARIALIAFYGIAVALMSVYLHLGSLYDQILLDSVPTRSYEYIIVGAGTAGLTVAAGLPSNSVLLLEAGHSVPSALHDVPLFTPMLQRSAFDWGHHTSAQSSACGALSGQRSRWPLGRGYGGSQILNYMMWTRAHREDYRGWFAGADEYDYERDVRPYFEAAEQHIGLQTLPWHTRLARAFVNASKEFGYATGFYIPQVTQLHGRRYTNAHHGQRQRRAGHETVLGAHVHRLLFDVAPAAVADDAAATSTQPPTVAGVLYERNGQMVRVRATHGVILSGGTVGSPVILQASGIGPREVLVNATNAPASDAVPLRADLRGVGRNLQDHVTTGVDLLLLRSPLGVRPWDVLTPHALYEYLATAEGRGPLTMCGCEALGFVDSADTAGNGSTRPDIGFMVLPMGATGDGGVHLRHLLNIDAAVWSRYFDPLIGQHSASILPVVLHPRSRGTVELRATRRGAGPQSAGTMRGGVHEVHINPNYLTDAADVETLVRGLRIVEQMLEMPALRGLGIEVNPMPFPGCEDLEFRSAPYWRCYVRQLTLTAYHPVGTCRMGDADDEWAVVGRDYRVHGVRKVWVVDASVMPSLPSGNPNAAVAMLAQRFVAQHRRRAPVR